MMGVGISSIAYSLGSCVLTNDELKKQFPHWNFEYLETRTGVKERPICGPNETALDFAVNACKTLIDSGELRPDEVDAVIFCTETPDHIIPPNACILHDALGLQPNTAAFDITHACSGYPYALMLAKSMVVSGAASQVLIANSDTYSKLISPQDRATRALFGDGGAVSIITAKSPEFVIKDIHLGTAGAYYKRFYIEGGGARVPDVKDIYMVEDKSGNIRGSNHISMDGLGILTFFNTLLPSEIKNFLGKNNLLISDIDLMISHQSSAVSLEGLRRALKIENEQFFVDIEKTGNLVSASIPIAFSRASKNKKMVSGDKILLCGFGVGLSWGLVLLEVA